MRLIVFIVCSLIITIESSKCPEPRKPHSTSCTIFYNCVNLPDGGGYVWVPSKCTDGLVFQPYLRMCVLPGDSWTCDTLSIEPSFIRNRYEPPEIINPNETSYLGSTEDPLNFSEFIDSSYTTDNIPDMLDQEMVTPYPLIEIEETMESMNDKNTKKAPEFNSVQYGYVQAQNDNKKLNSKDKYSMLNRLIHHLLVYKEISIPLEYLASSSLPMPSESSVNTKEMLSNEPKPSTTNQCNILKLQNTITTDIKVQSTSDTTRILKDDTRETMSSINNSSSTPKTVFSDLDNENNIILITNDAGDKRYITIEEYKSMDHNLDSQFVQVIPCVKNIRMPNITNCVKYYTCEPETATITEYNCPSNTAFNKYTRMCKSESYSACIDNKLNKKNVQIDKDSINISQINLSEKNVCTELGKTKDPTSDSRYYICYSSEKSHGIKSMRMTCPNELIFCQSKKLCTRKRTCKKT